MLKSKFYIFFFFFIFILSVSSVSSCKNVLNSKNDNSPECKENNCSLRFHKPHFVSKVSELSSPEASKWFYIENSSSEHINIKPEETPVFFLSDEKLLLTKKIDVNNVSITLTLYRLKNGKTEVLSSKNLPEQTSSVISSCIMTNGTIALLHKTEIEKPSREEEPPDNNIWYVISITDSEFDSWENYSVFKFESTKEGLFKILFEKNTPEKNPLSVHCSSKENLVYLSTAIYYRNLDMENIAVYSLDTDEKSLVQVAEYYKKTEENSELSSFNLNSSFDASEKVLYLMDDNFMIEQKGFSFPRKTKMSGKKNDFILTSSGYPPTFAFIRKEKPEKLIFSNPLK